MPEGGEAEVVEAVLVLRAGLEHGDLRRVDESPVVVRDFTEVAGDVVGQAEVALPAVVAGVVPVEPMEVLTPAVGLEHGARAQRQARADLHVLELLDPLRERGVEHVRLREAGAVLHPVAGGHERRSVSCGDAFRSRTACPAERHRCHARPPSLRDCAGPFRDAIRTEVPPRETLRGPAPGAQPAAMRSGSAPTGPRAVAITEARSHPRRDRDAAAIATTR